MAIISTESRAHLVAILCDAVEEDRSILTDLLAGLGARFEAPQLVEPTVMGPWLITDPGIHAFRYVVSVGGSGPWAGIEVEVKTGETTWRAYAGDGSGDPHEIGRGYATEQEARDAADAWARTVGWTLA